MRTKGTKNQKSPAAEVALTTLAPGQAQHLVKPHTGFEEWVEKLAEIFTEFSSDLGGGGVDIELMRTSLASYQALASPRDKAARTLAQFDDSRLVHSSVTWDQMMTIYRHAKAGTKKNGALAKQLKPFEQWMKTGPKKKPAPSTTTPTP